MWLSIKDWFDHLYQSILDWFHRSETILWARAQVAIGFVMAVLPMLSPATWFDEALTPTQRWTVALIAIANGVWTEYLRRRRGGATEL